MVRRLSHLVYRIQGSRLVSSEPHKCASAKTCCCRHFKATWIAPLFAKLEAVAGTSMR